MYPGDIERALIGHPSIADAGVVQVITEGGSEVVVAFVVVSAGSDATEDEVLAFARQHFAPHQVPSSVRFADHLPRNSVGKLIRADLRTLAAP